jgi:hypothetical protein
MAFKQKITAETAIESFIRCKKNNEVVPNDVLDSIKGYSNWSENQLKGILNASAYFPEILTEENMEANILKLIENEKKRIIPTRFI